MKPTRRGFFRAILALPFSPKCIQAFRPKPCVHRKAINAYACDRCGKGWGEIAMQRAALSYREGGHLFYDLQKERDGDLKFLQGQQWDQSVVRARPCLTINRINPEKR